MLFNLTPAELILRLIVLLISMTVHEFAHVYVAYLAGDTTAADQGKLTLNPFAHIHWAGFLMFMVIGFGILGTAAVNPHRMRNQRWGYFAAVAAGPFSNLLLAVIVALPVKLGLLSIAGGSLAPSGTFPAPADFMVALIWWNIILFLFNLLPLFPIDGYTMVRMAMPIPARYSWEDFQTASQYILLGLIIVPLLLPALNILGLLIGGPANALFRLLVV